MQDKCDILILTANFGNGHISVSNAITEYIHLIDSNIHIKTEDFYEIVNPLIYKNMYKGYGWLVKYGYKLINYEYQIKNSGDKPKKIYTASTSNLTKLAKYLEETNPSLVISTFPTCTGYMSRYKEEYNSNIPLVTCITDVVDGIEWIYEGNDMYFVAADDVKEKLINKGIDRNKITTTGIPVRKSFINEKDKSSIRKKWNINQNDYVILIMGGSLGIIPEEEEFYQWLNNNKQLTVIILTGKNKSVYNKFSKYNDFDNIRILEYTDKVDELMQLSDLLITKAGGITLFEAIASKLPFIVYKPILGQELENCKFIENCKL